MWLVEKKGSELCWSLAQDCDSKGQSFVVEEFELDRLGLKHLIEGGKSATEAAFASSNRRRLTTSILLILSCSFISGILLWSISGKLLALQ